MRDLKGKVAVVTGAASGIGLALCERFAKEGMRLVMADLKGPALDEQAQRLAASGTEVLPVPTDVSSWEAGHIVNTASTAGLMTAKYNAPYSVSKFGVVALTETLYQELRAAGAPIGASVLCPGTVRTRLRENSNRLGPTGAPVGLHPEGRLPNERTPAEVAERVCDAIQNERFWILTHPEIGELVRRRVRGMLETNEVVGAR